VITLLNGINLESPANINASKMARDSYNEYAEEVKKLARSESVIIPEDED
jgi:ubiquitin-protein ligase